MKRFFAFFSKLLAFIAMACVVLYCIGYFFASKTKRLHDLFVPTQKNDEDDE